MKSHHNSNNSMILLFFSCIPILHIFVFSFFPLLLTLYFSFFSRNYLRTFGFVGFDNYLTLLSDSTFIPLLKNSLIYILMVVPLTLFSLMLAEIFNRKGRLYSLFKCVIFFPYMVNAIAVGLIFKFFYMRGSVLDFFLQQISIPIEIIPYWLRDKNINNIMLAFVNIWLYTGYASAIFSGAMTTIDKEIYECAQIDGANRFLTFFRITLPSIRNVVLLVDSWFIVGGISEFYIPYVLGSEGANGTATAMVQIFKTAHVSQKVGLASAMIIILIFIMVIITAILSKILRIFKEE